jgi:cbb3-type cytochrome oxidase subunit 3
LLLQAGETDVPDKISEFLILKYGLAGIVILALGYVVVYLVKRSNKQADKEKERILKEKDDAIDKNDILHTELKTFQSGEIAKYYALQENTNEINKQVADALNKFAGSNDNVARILDKIIDKI